VMAATSSPNRAKSADRIDGAILTRCGMARHTSIAQRLKEPGRRVPAR
jgi:hypothetical protein